MSDTTIKIIMRGISRNDVSTPDQQMFSSQEVNEYVSMWLNKGYELFASHYLGEIPAGYKMLFVLKMK